LDWGLCLAGYGTGAVMAVPCDERDYAFAISKECQALKNIF
jgi:hypothetical protein